MNVTHPQRIIDAHCHIGEIPPWKFYDLEHPVKPTVYDYRNTAEFVKNHMDEFKIERALTMSNYGVPVHEISFDLNDVVMDAAARKGWARQLRAKRCELELRTNTPFTIGSWSPYGDHRLTIYFDPALADGGRKSCIEASEGSTHGTSDSMTVPSKWVTNPAIKSVTERP